MGWTSWRSQICDRTSFHMSFLVWARASCVDGYDRHYALMVQGNDVALVVPGNVFVGFSLFCSLVVRFLWTFVLSLLC